MKRRDKTRRLGRRAERCTDWMSQPTPVASPGNSLLSRLRNHLSRRAHLKAIADREEAVLGAEGLHPVLGDIDKARRK